MDIISPEISKNDMFTIDEVWSRYNKIDDDQLERKITREEKQKRIGELVEELKNEAERFQHVYITESGSCYFQFENGKSWRIQKTETGWSAHPIYENVFFVPIEEYERLKREGEENPVRNANGANYMDKPITIGEIGVGMIPFEFEVDGMRKIGWEIVEEKLVIYGDSDGVMCSGTHFGHKITEVLK